MHKLVSTALNGTVNSWTGLKNAPAARIYAKHSDVKIIHSSFLNYYLVLVLMGLYINGFHLFLNLDNQTYQVQTYHHHLIHVDST